MSETTFPARGDISPSAVRTRIAELCEWFGAPPVNLKVRKGVVIFTDELATWCSTEGISFDWLFLGEPKALALAYREKHGRTPEEREWLQIFDRLNEAGKHVVLAELQAVAARKITMEEFEARISTHFREQRQPAEA